MIKAQLFGLALLLGTSMAAQAQQTFAGGSARTSASTFARGAMGGGSRCGCQHTPAPIPEAETYTMLLAGLGLITSVVRRRRQSR